MLEYTYTHAHTYTSIVFVVLSSKTQHNMKIDIVGSYDHTVKMFDTRTNKSVISVEHGQPVESVLLFPSGGLLVSAGISFKNSFRQDCWS